MINRRDMLKLMGVGLSTVIPWKHLRASDKIVRRAIPSTDEKLPVIGLGTWQTFDVGSSESERKPLRGVLETMIELGGRVIDSSPMYGESENVVGDLTSATGKDEHFFYATKVWTQFLEAGIEQMNGSLSKMKRRTMDLMQIHNLVDWTTHLPTLRRWKTEKRIRYIGITHYTASAHAELERVMRSEQIDFVQCNFSIDDRQAEKRLLPAAQELGVAVLINRPFGGGNLFQSVRGRDLPEWAAEWDIATWAQFFLKYIVSHPAVTCALAGTSKPHHARDNLLAGYGALPDEKTRKQMADFFDRL